MMNERIGPYEVIRELGRGGMGVVYLANDTRLDRQVAIKALPTELASDPARLERFEREAKTLASLNHPNLAGIYGVEEQEGARYLVLEYVDGETLEHALDRGAMPVDEAIGLAAAIAAGVEAAHDAGVIHRDLKPANIVITPEGVPKVLDFGLARIDDGSSSTGNYDAETLSMHRQQHSPTIEGAILGTAAYMSPEQARGRRVDKRTDIWSFGVVLYEMLTGQSPFRGETASDSIGAVLHKNFDLDALPAETPGHVVGVLGRCLQRDRNLRYRDIGDARLDLLTPTRMETSGAQRTGVLGWCVAAALLLVAIGAMGFAVMRPAAQTARAVVNFSFDVPLVRDSLSAVPGVCISEDGRSIAVQADNDGYDPIYVRHLNRDGLIRVETPWAESPELIRWTRDGRSLIVLRGGLIRGELWKISPSGDAPRLICTLPEDGFLWTSSVEYLDDETLIIGMAPAGLWTVPERGGSVRLYLAPSEEDEILVSPRVVPGTDAIVFFEVNAGRLELYRDGQRRLLYDFQGDRFSSLALSDKGHIYVTIHSGRLSPGTSRLDFDLDRLEVTSDPFLVFANSMVDFADDGTMVRAERTAAAPVMRELVWVNPDGTIGEVLATGLANARGVSSSPDGTRAAVSLISSASLGSGERDYDIAVIDLGTGARYELEDRSGNDYYAFWSADGERLMYNTYNAGVRRASQRLASGADQPTTVFDRSLIARPSDDGRYVLSNIDRMSYLMVDEQTPRLVWELRTSDFDLNGDSRFLAYTPGEDGKGLRIQRFPEGGAMTTVTSMDATGLSWSHDDSAIYFWADDAFWSAAVDVSGPQPIVSPPTKMFDREANRIIPSRIYGIGSDGRFLMLRNPEEMPELTESIDVHVGLGWGSDQDQD